MDFDTSTPRAARTIGGYSVQVIQPFAEGQALTQATAAMLNQTLAENFSNNLRKALTEAATADANADLQAIADAYMFAYQPGVRTGGGGGTGRVADPEEKEARAIAKAKVSQLLKDRGLKQKDVDMGDLVEKLYTKHRDTFHKEAATVIKARTKAAQGTSDLEFDLGLGDDSPVAAEG